MIKFIKNWYPLFLWALAIYTFMTDDFWINLLTPKVEITESIDTTKTEQTFTASEVNKLIAVNIDSIDNYYKNNPITKTKIRLQKVDVDSIFNEAKKYWGEKLNGADLGSQIYETGIDTNYIAVDTTGRVTDSIGVHVSYYSRLPPDPKSFMSLNLVHKNFDYTKTITVKETIVNDPLFSSGIFFGAGYGLINKKFDVFVGYGVTLKFDFKKLIGELL